MSLYNIGKVTTAYGYGLPFNAGPPQANKEEGGRRNEDRERLVLLEKPTISPTIPVCLLNRLPSLLDHHRNNRRERIHALALKNCVYSAKPESLGFWYIVNAKRRASIPDPSSPFDPTVSRWLDDAKPYLGFTPTFGANEGYAIAAIRITDDVIKNIINPAHEKGYKLDADVSKMWRETERTFLSLALMLKGPLGHLPNLHQPLPPSSHKYAAIFPTFESAFSSIRAARDAFSEMTTFLSFLLSFWRYTDAVYPFANLLQYCKAHLPEQYTALHALVHASNVGDFRVGTRSGYLVNFSGTVSAWIPYLHIWAEAGVPLWISGGKDPRLTCESAIAPTTVVSQALADWIPNTTTLQAAYQVHQGEGQGDLSAPPLFSTKLIEGEHGLIFGLSHFGFRDGDYEPGMHPGYYFPRRVSTLRAWLASRGNKPEILERVSVDVSRWSRIFEGRRLYVWEEERGSWTRRRIPGPLRRAYFEVFAPECRRWCPISRELDLCRWLGENPLHLAPPAAATPVTRPISTLPLPDPERSAPVPQPTSVPSHSSPIALPTPQDNPVPYHELGSDEDEYDDWDAEQPEICAPQPRPAVPATVADVVFRPSELRSLEDTLRTRLGYDYTIALPKSHSLITSPLFREKGTTIDNALQCLGHKRTPRTDYEDALLLAAIDAVNSLLSYGLNVRDGLVYNRDILPGRLSPHSLETPPSLPNSLAAYPIKFTNASGEVSPRCMIATSAQPVISQWYVLVVEPSVLMQICRSGATTMGQIGRYLIQNGLPFHTAIHSSARKKPVERPIIRTILGNFTSETPLVDADFELYEAKKVEFLNTPRGALALKKGGIVWRLAVDALCSERVRQALTRPTLRAETIGVNCGVANDGKMFVDDDLETHELDIILGAFRYRGMEGKGDKKRWGQERPVYLWPTPSAWRRSGLNAGEWTADAEEWYQFRLREINERRATLRASGGWRKAIKFQTETRIVWRNYDQAVMDTFFHDA